MRKFFNKKTFKYGLNATILTLVVLGIVILLNVALSRYSYRKDITETKNYELSEQSKKVLASIEKSGKPVDVYLFTSVDYEKYIYLEQKDMIERLLKEYERQSKSFRLKLIDINKNPGMAQKYGVVMPYEVAFDSEGRTKVVTYRDIFEVNSGLGFNGEQAFTSALISVMNEKRPVVYFIEGHKEPSFDTLSIYRLAMDREGYLIKQLNIAQQGMIPEDATMLVDIGAKTDFPAREIEIIRSYLDNGGKAIFLTSAFYNKPEIPALLDMLRSYGVQVNNDIVEDPAKNFYDAKDMIYPEYTDHRIIGKLAEDPQKMVIPGARSIDLIGADTTVEPLLKSSVDSWGETNLDEYNNQNVILDANDKKGPLTLGVYVTKPVGDDKKMEMIVVGNSLFLSNDALQYTKSTPNIDFILNSMSALRGTLETATIKAKVVQDYPLWLSGPAQRNLFLYLVFFLPGVVLLSGLVIWLRRRHL